MPSLLLALMLACTAPTPAPEAGKAPMDARAKAAKVQQMKAAKAKAAKVRMARAKAGKAGKAGRSAGPQRVGAAGPIKGALRLTEQGEGENQKTRAQLAMQWEGGQTLALLGVTAGACEEVAPKEVASGVMATWWATCEWKGMQADFAMVISSGMVLVQRAITKDGTQGEWVTVRRVHLVEGAELAPGEVTDPAAPKAPDAPAADGAPAPAPAAAPTEAPAPAPADPNE